MGKHIYDTDPNGLKLYGRCKYFGECRCGNCADAPANRLDQVKITKSDGSVEHVQASAVGTVAEGQEETGAFRRPEGEGPTPKVTLGRKMPAFNQQNRKRCPDCGVALRSDHKCKARGVNGPVVTRLPGGEPLVEHKSPRVATSLPAVGSVGMPGVADPPPTCKHCAALGRRCLVHLGWPAALEPDPIQGPDKPLIDPNHIVEPVTASPERHNESAAEIIEVKGHEIIIKMAGVEITIRPMEVSK